MTQFDNEYNKDGEALSCEPEYITAQTTSTQAVTAGDYVGNLVTIESSGMNIVNGTYIELKAGVTYSVEASVGIAPVSTGGLVIFRLKDSVTGAAISSAGQAISQNANTVAGNQATVSTHYTPTQDTTVGILLNSETLGEVTLRGGFTYLKVQSLNCVPQTGGSIASVSVDSTEDSTFGFEATDIHNNGATVGLTDKTLQSSFSRTDNIVTYAGTPDKLEISLSLNAEDSGASGFWSRPKMRILREGNIVAVFDNLVMQQDGNYDGDATLNGYFLDKNPGTNPAYTFEWFDEENRTATLIPNGFSQLSLTATNKILVKKA